MSTLVDLHTVRIGSQGRSYFYISPVPVSPRLAFLNAARYARANGLEFQSLTLVKPIVYSL